MGIDKSYGIKLIVGEIQLGQFANFIINGYLKSFCQTKGFAFSL